MKNRHLRTRKVKRGPLKPFADFTPEDIEQIIKHGKEKYTIKEISDMLELNKEGCKKVLDEHKIVTPKKPNNLQRLYERGLMHTDQFYIEASSLIKSRLMQDLIYKGYFKDGKRQISYDTEDVNDCFTYILRKIKDKYDPKLGTLATFIRNWVRGYGTTITTSQHRRYKKVGNDSSLDENYNNSFSDAFKDAFKIKTLEDGLDKTSFPETLEYDSFLEKEMDDTKAKFFKSMLRDLEA